MIRRPQESGRKKGEKEEVAAPSVSKAPTLSLVK